jgi:hypothetical protein
MEKLRRSYILNPFRYVKGEYVGILSVVSPHISESIGSISNASLTKASQRILEGDFVSYGSHCDTDENALSLYLNPKGELQEKQKAVWNILFHTSAAAISRRNTYMCSLVIEITFTRWKEHLPPSSGGALRKANHFTTKQMFLADVTHVLRKMRKGARFSQTY